MSSVPLVPPIPSRGDGRVEACRVYFNSLASVEEVERELNKVIPPNWVFAGCQLISASVPLLREYFIVFWTDGLMSEEEFVLKKREIAGSEFAGLAVHELDWIVARVPSGVYTAGQMM